MSTDRPLDLLIPGLRPPPKGSGIRFLVADVGGAPHWVSTLEQDPGGLRVIHEQLARFFEGALLHALARPRPDESEARAALSVPLGGLHLLHYAPIERSVAPAVRAFGLRPSTPSGARWDEIARAFHQLAGRAPRPWREAFSAEVTVDTTVPAAELALAHQALVEETGDVWGAEPGAHARRLLDLAERVGGTKLDLDLAGLDAIEAMFVPRTPGALRWVFPMFFQGIADLVGVLASHLYKTRLGWAVGEEEPDGFVPPPAFEVQPKKGGTYVVPIGHHLVRWCVMPLEAGEAIPPLSAWLRDQFDA